MRAIAGAWAVPSSYILLFLLAVVAVEVQLPGGDLNVGNLVLLFGSSLLILLSVYFRSQRGGTVELVYQDFILLLYIIYCGLTILWSRSRADTLAQTLFLFVSWMSVVNLASASPEKIARIFVRIVLGVAIVSVVLAIITPDFAYQPHSSTGFEELRGVLKHQQRLGLLMSVGLGLIFIAFLNGQLGIIIGRNRQIVFIFVIVISFVCVWAFARSYTAFMFLSLMLTMLFCNPRRWFAFFIAALFLVGLMFLIFGDVLLGVFGDSDSNVTLSGRTIIWGRTWIVAQSRLLEGFGFGSFFDRSFDGIWGTYRPPHAHNSFLQVLFETGYIGVLLLLAFIAVQFRDGIRFARRFRGYSYSIFLLFLTVLASTTGVSYGGKPNVLFGILLLMSAAEARAVKRANFAEKNYPADQVLV